MCVQRIPPPQGHRERVLRIPGARPWRLLPASDVGAGGVASNFRRQHLLPFASARMNASATPVLGGVMCTSSVLPVLGASLRSSRGQRPPSGRFNDDNRCRRPTRPRRRLPAHSNLLRCTLGPHRRARPVDRTRVGCARAASFLDASAHVGAIAISMSARRQRRSSSRRTHLRFTRSPLRPSERWV